MARNDISKYEDQYMHDAEMAYMIANRRNRLLASWIADEVGMGNEEKKHFVHVIIEDQALHPGDDEALVDHLIELLNSNDYFLPEDVVREKATELYEIAEDRVKKSHH